MDVDRIEFHIVVDVYEHGILINHITITTNDLRSLEYMLVILQICNHIGVNMLVMFHVYNHIGVGALMARFDPYLH